MISLAVSNPSFSKSTFIHLIGGVVAAGSSFLLAPIYLRLLSPDEYGVWSQFLLLFQILQPIMSWGLLSSITRMLVDASPQTRPQIISAAIMLATRFNLVILFVIGGLHTILAVSVSHSELSKLPLLAASTGLLGAYPLILMGIYLADGNALKYRSISLIGFLLQLGVLSIAASLLQFDAERAAIAFMIAVGLCSAYAYSKVRPIIGDTPFSRVQAKSLLGFGLPVVLYTLVGQSVELIIRSFVTVQSTKAEFGSFSAGLMLASVIAMISSAINLAWIPFYYRKAAVWNTSGLYRSYVEMFVTGLTFISACLIVFSQELLFVYSGGSVNLPVSVLSGLVIAGWLNSSVWMSLTNPLFQGKRMKAIIFMTFTTAVITLPLASGMIKHHGLVGASWALALGAFISCFIGGCVLRGSAVVLNYKHLIYMLSLLLVLSGLCSSWLSTHDVGIVRIFFKILLMILLFVLLAFFYLKNSLITIKRIESEITI